MELYHTIDLMASTDYRNRFIGEYWQTKIRYEKLSTFIRKIEVTNLTGAEPPKHDCPLELLEDQKYYMECYLDILEKRAIVENIDVSSPFGYPESETEPDTKLATSVDSTKDAKTIYAHIY